METAETPGVIAAREAGWRMMEREDLYEEWAADAARVRSEDFDPVLEECFEVEQARRGEATGVLVCARDLKPADRFRLGGHEYEVKSVFVDLDVAEVSLPVESGAARWCLDADLLVELT